MSRKNTVLKTLRNQARADTVGMPQRRYQRMPNGMIVAVKSTRARYLQLKYQAGY